MAVDPKPHKEPVDIETTDDAYSLIRGTAIVMRQQGFEKSADILDASLAYLEEQLEALEASNAAAGTLAGMFSVVAHEARAYCEELNSEGSASTDALEAALRVAYPAKRRLTAEAEKQWREMVDPYLEPSGS